MSTTPAGGGMDSSSWSKLSTGEKAAAAFHVALSYIPITSTVFGALIKADNLADKKLLGVDPSKVGPPKIAEEIKIPWANKTLDRSTVELVPVFGNIALIIHDVKELIVSKLASQTSSAAVKASGLHPTASALPPGYLAKTPKPLPETPPKRAARLANALIGKLNALPESKKYQLYNPGGPMANVAAAARDNMNALLNSLGRKFVKNKNFDLSIDLSKPFWMINVNKIKDNKIYKVDNFELKGSEIKALIASTKVSYDANQAGLTKDALKEILTQGAKDRNISRGRCVGTDVVMVKQLDGTPISRKASEPLPKFRVYTMNAPNLSSPEECKGFLSNAVFHGTPPILEPGAQLNRDAYKAEMKALLTHYLMECKADGVDVPVIPGFGLGAFLPDNFKAEGRQCFAEALKEALEAQKGKFPKVIFSDPNPDLVAIMTQAFAGTGLLEVSHKSGIDVVQAGAKDGLKMAFLNPGDPSGYPGQWWEGGEGSHVALEELLGLFTTLALSSHPGVAPQVSQPETYVTRNIRGLPV